jgi:hypothetical protein
VSNPLDLRLVPPRALSGGNLRRGVWRRLIGFRCRGYGSYRRSKSSVRLILILVAVLILILVTVLAAVLILVAC